MAYINLVSGHSCDISKTVKRIAFLKYNIHSTNIQNSNKDHELDLSYFWFCYNKDCSFKNGNSERDVDSEILGSLPAKLSF